MSSLFSHIFIPLSILYIFSKRLKIDQRKIFQLSFFGILPDADIILFHRATLHNIFILIIPIILFIFIKDIREISGIISFYIFSHLLLDLFDGGIFLLYPLYNSVFFIQIDFWFNKGLIPILNYGISKVIMNNGRGEPMISSENIGISALIVIILIIYSIKNKIKEDIK